MSHSREHTRRKLQCRPVGEMLEGRQLLTGGAGSIFALVPGEVTVAKQPATHTFTIGNDHFTLKNRGMTLGIDIAATKGSTVQPKVAAVTNAAGKALKISYPVGGVLKAKSSTGNVDARNGAALVTISNVPSQGVGLTTQVTGDGGTTGAFLLGYYLPGDADGDGAVKQADITAITSAMGTIVGDDGYVFDADTNRDGRIGMNDLTIARKNLGVSTTIMPVLSANLDEISDSGTANRETVYQNVVFNGQSSPGATITYTEKDGKTPSVTTTAISDGQYQLTVPLAEGSNTFVVTSTDRFGQVISGTIAAVTYVKPLVPVESPTKAAPVPTTPTDDGTKDDTTNDRASRIKARQAAQADQAAKLRELRASRQNGGQQS